MDAAKAQLVEEIRVGKQDNDPMAFDDGSRIRPINEGGY